MKVKIYVDNDWTKECSLIDVSNEATEEEIEQAVRETVLNYITWNYEIVKNY